MRDFWTHAFLGALLLGQLVLVSSQSQGGTSRLQGLMLGALTPFGRWAADAAESTGRIGESFSTRASLHRENLELKVETARLRREVVRLHGVEDDLARLARTSGYRRAPTSPGVVADVVFVDDSTWLRTLVVHAAGARPRRNQPVVTPEGLVGRVIVASGAYAKVQLATDRSSAVSATIARTRRKGIVQGDGQGALLLQYVPARADVLVGDTVTTAGIDGVFPRGIPIGTVAAITPDGLFHRLVVTPAVDLGVLDQVYVLTQEVLPEDVKEALVDAGD